EELVGERTYLTTKSPLRDEQGRVIGLIGVATDITERKNAQRELEKLVVAEQRLRAEAERANRAKDEFLAIVSHELRSPLNALRGWSHLLQTTRPLDGALVDRASKAIKRNVDHQTRLIDDLLDTSRIVSGKLTIERRVVNLVDTVHAALDAARPVAQAKHMELRFAPADPATMVIGDAGRLQQLVSNLLSNAVKFTPEQGAVSVILHKSGERVQLQVKDDDVDAHEVLALTLRQAGAEVECFNSGRSLGAALEALQPGQGPHVLLIDLAMPGEDGFEALRRARAIELARGNERYTPALA